MTVCTYDDRAVAQEHADRLKAAGLKGAVAPCLLEDPDQPGVELFDLVVPGRQVAQAQSVLGIIPPTGDESDDRAEGGVRRGGDAIVQADRWFAQTLLAIVALSALLYFLRRWLGV